MAKNGNSSTPDTGPSSTSRPLAHEQQSQRDASEKSGQKGTASAKKRQAEYGPLITDTIFPDASAVFTALPISLTRVKDTACIVLDTSALLLPYEVGRNSLEKVESTYKKLIEENRLFIPAQVAREFARNRARKLGELHQILAQRRDQFQPKLLRPQDKYPLLETFKEGQEVGSIEKSLGEIDKQIETIAKEYRDKLSGALERIRSWEWNDPVSQIYAKLFKPDRIVYASQGNEYILDEHQRRYTHRIPPGVSDQGKDDGGIGDLLIWLTILDIGKKQNQSVIFITGERKADWWSQSGGKPIYPRYELLDEFRRNTEHSFHMLQLSALLEYSGATTQIVEEIRDKEKQVTHNALRDRNAISMPDASTTTGNIRTSDMDRIQELLTEAQRQEEAALSALASLPADSPNDSISLPWSRQWHRAQQDLAASRQRIAEMETLLRDARAANRYTGIPCIRCGQLTMGSAGSNRCGNCGYITDD